MITYSAILLLAGKGERSCLPFNKVYAKIGEKFVYQYSLDKFLDDNDCQEVIVVYNEADLDYLKDLRHDKVKLILGGSSRTESVKNGVDIASSDYVFIHDGARPLLNKNMLDACKKALENRDAVALAHPVADTIRNRYTNETIDRSLFLAMETPQCIKTNLMKRALEKSSNYTDDIQALDGLNANIYLIENNEVNIKITYQYDLDVVKAILEKR